MITEHRTIGYTLLWAGLWLQKDRGHGPTLKGAEPNGDPGTEQLSGAQEVARAHGTDASLPLCIH